MATLASSPLGTLRPAAGIPFNAQRPQPLETRARRSASRSHSSGQLILHKEFRAILQFAPALECFDVHEGFTCPLDTRVLRYGDLLIRPHLLSLLHKIVRH